MVPHLFSAIDHPLHDPVTAKAREYTSAHLDPVTDDWTQRPGSGHSLTIVKSVDLSPSGQAWNPVESSLSRVVSKIIGVLIQSTSRFVTVSILKINDSLKLFNAVTR